MDVGVATGIGLTGAGVGSVAVLDRLIDVTAHDHTHWAYKAGGLPTRALFGAGVALAGVGLLAGLDEDTKRYRGTLLKVAAGAGVAYLATMAFRTSWGLTVAPAQVGWRAGMPAEPHFRLGDIAGNAIDRTRMMGRDPDLARWPLFSRISELQGHGSLVERADEFVPVLRFPGVKY